MIKHKKEEKKLKILERYAGSQKWRAVEQKREDSCFRYFNISIFENKKTKIEPLMYHKIFSQ